MFPDFKLQVSSFDNWRLLAAMCLEKTRGWLTDPLSAAETASRRLGLDLRALSDMQGSSVLAELAQRGRWAMSGYPTVRPTHRAAASWMATNFRSLDTQVVQSPWPSFVIQVPTGMLWVTAEDGTLHEVAVISATCIDARWAYSISTNPCLVRDGRKDGLNIWAFGVSASVLGGSELPVRPDEWSDIARTATDERTESLARKLILGVCLHYADPATRTNGRVHRARSTKQHLRTPDTLPDYTAWEMTSSVSIDVVRAIKEWSRTGEGRSPTVQSLVAGHGKWQPHGPNRSLRKWIHVQPYWRGPEDAPVANRSGEGCAQHARAGGPETRTRGGLGHLDGG